MCILTFTISRRNNNIDRVCSEKVICLDKGVFIRILKSYRKTGRVKNELTFASYPAAKDCVYFILNSCYWKTYCHGWTENQFCFVCKFAVLCFQWSWYKQERKNCSKAFHFWKCLADLSRRISLWIFRNVSWLLVGTTK